MVAHEDEFLPLLAFSGNSILYVYNLEKGSFYGTIRGHGAVRVELHRCLLRMIVYDQVAEHYFPSGASDVPVPFVLRIA